MPVGVSITLVHVPAFTLQVPDTMAMQVRPELHWLLLDLHGLQLAFWLPGFIFAGRTQENELPVATQTYPFLHLDGSASGFPFVPVLIQVPLPGPATQVPP